MRENCGAASFAELGGRMWEGFLLVSEVIMPAMSAAHLKMFRNPSVTRQSTQPADRNRMEVFVHAFARQVSESWFFQKPEPNGVASGVRGLRVILYCAQQRR